MILIFSNRDKIHNTEAGAVSNPEVSSSGDGAISLLIDMRLGLTVTHSRTKTQTCFIVHCCENRWDLPPSGCDGRLKVSVLTLFWVDNSCDHVNRDVSSFSRCRNTCIYEQQLRVTDEFTRDVRSFPLASRQPALEHATHRWKDSRFGPHCELALPVKPPDGNKR